MSESVCGGEEGGVPHWGLCRAFRDASVSPPERVHMCRWVCGWLGERENICPEKIRTFFSCQLQHIYPLRTCAARVECLVCQFVSLFVCLSTTFWPVQVF